MSPEYLAACCHSLWHEGRQLLVFIVPKPSQLPMVTLASPFETDAPRIRFSRHNSRFVAKSAQRFRGTLTYDVKGNLVTRPASLQSPALSLVWDFDNKLMGADTNGTPASLEVTYEYDALGRRVARSGPGGNMVYFQAGQQTIADCPRGGVPASSTYRYVNGSYIDEPLLRETVSGSVRHFFHRNQQYSVTSLTDSTGNTAERYAYTAYGALTVFNSSGIPQATSPLNNRYTYTGREWDDSTKLYHFRAQWYDPVAGRFVGRDPLGFVDGMLLFANGFDLAQVDPLGLTILAEAGVGCGIGGLSAVGGSVIVDAFPANFDGICCSGAGAFAEGCIGGAVNLALSTKLPPFFGAVTGCLAGGISKFVGDGIRWGLDCGDKLGLCDFVQALGGCVTTGAGGIDVETPKFNKTVQSLVGFDIGIYTGLCTDGEIAAPPVNFTGIACCKFRSGSTGTIYNKSVACSLGRPSMACCVEKARGIIFTAAVLDVRLGLCQ